MQSPPPHISDRDDRVTGQFLLNCEVPVPGLGVLECFALRSHSERKLISRSAAGIIRDSTIYAGRRLEGGISAQEDGVAYAHTREEAAATSADYRLWCHLVSKTEPRLYLPPLNIGVVISNSSEQVVKSS